MVSQLSRDNLIIAVKCFESITEIKDRIIIGKTLKFLPADSTNLKKVHIESEDV